MFSVEPNFFKDIKPQTKSDQHARTQKYRFYDEKLLKDELYLAKEQETIN